MSLVSLERSLPSSTPGPEPLFDGVFLGGFECSCHQLEDGTRLDLHASTRHDELACEDYTRLRHMGMTACRDGVSWVGAEKRRGEYDFSAALRLLGAADRTGMSVIWDLMHFGWPQDVDVFAPSFPGRFARYATAFATFLATHSDAPAMIAPINEVSFLSWAGADVRVMNPFSCARGVELKVQLVRATIEAIEGIRGVLPSARFLQPEPLIHIVPSAAHPKTWRRVEADNELQFQAWDMLCGRIWPALGGHPRYLDVIGVNFYPDNQFMLDGATVRRGDERYRPFASMLLETWGRYRRPMMISETGTEGDARPSWLRYVAEQCMAAMAEGCELHGITLYPVVNHPGWVDGRRCENGLWDFPDATGHRAVHEPFAEELHRQAPRLTAARARVLRHEQDVSASA